MKVRQTVRHTIKQTKKGVNAVLIEEYISEGGVHIKINDASMYTSQEEIEQAYRNWGRIATRILLNNQRRKEMENAGSEEKNDEPS